MELCRATCRRTARRHGLVDVEPDGALTVRHEGTFASLRVVTIADDIEMVSLTQVLAWDLPLNADSQTRRRTSAQRPMLGTVTLVEQPAQAR